MGPFGGHTIYRRSVELANSTRNQAVDVDDYRPVLAAKKPVETQKKGKGYKDAQWEAEVRKSLAEKKKNAGASTLSKQDQALVQAQLEKEAVIRRNVESVKANLLRGLQYVEAIVAARSQELQLHLSAIVNILLNGAFGKAITLIGDSSFHTYVVRIGHNSIKSRSHYCFQRLAECCSSRIGSFNKWIGIATLRSLGVPAIPDELQAEPINRE